MGRQINNQQKEVDMEKLIALYGDELLRLCYLYLHDWQLAEDAVQETYIRVYRKYSEFEEKSSEKTWITRIAMNVCKSYLRTPWRKKVLYGELNSARDEEKDAVEAAFRDDTVISAIHQLKPAYREIVLLFYYQELKVREIAEILGISESAVTVRLTRARKQLKDKLERWYFDE